jgi:TIR domain
MASVFISYASEQQAVAQQLEAELVAKGVNAWRDKTRLHAGERWPKALGDAIADSEALILLWSAEAEQSDFVELEWNIAVAMNKPVIPCLIDATSLPSTLKPSHSLPDHDISQTAERIRTAIGQSTTTAPRQPQKVMLAKLEKIPASEGRSVLQEVKSFINQPNWTVQTVYQVQGDLHVNQQAEAKAPKPPVERMGAWVALLVGVLTIVGWVLDLPQKLGWVTGPPSNGDTTITKIKEYPFEGQVIDSQGQGLDDVNVSLIVPGQKPLTVKTQKKGVFAFKVLTVVDKAATLQAEKAGFAPKRRNVTIPDQRYVLKMEPRHKEQRP